MANHYSEKSVMVDELNIPTQIFGITKTSVFSGNTQSRSASRAGLDAFEDTPKILYLLAPKAPFAPP